MATLWAIPAGGAKGKVGAGLEFPLAQASPSRASSASKAAWFFQS